MSLSPWQCKQTLTTSASSNLTGVNTFQTNMNISSVWWFDQCCWASITVTDERLHQINQTTVLQSSQSRRLSSLEAFTLCDFGRSWGKVENHERNVVEDRLHLIQTASIKFSQCDCCRGLRRHINQSHSCMKWFQYAGWRWHYEHPHSQTPHCSVYSLL